MNWGIHGRYFIMRNNNIYGLGVGDMNGFRDSKPYVNRRGWGISHGDPRSVSLNIYGLKLGF